MWNEAALHALRDLLIRSFPGKIDRVVFYGSRARGRGHEDADYDFLVVMREPFDWQLKNQIQDAAWEVDAEYGIVTDLRLISRSDLETIKGRQPFVIEALEHGTPI